LFFLWGGRGVEVGRVIEENRGKREQMECKGKAAIRSKRLIDGVAAGANGWAACSLPVQTIEWELREQQVWQRPCNKTPPSLTSLNLGGT